VAPARERVASVSNARLAMVALVMAESMLFAGLIGTYLVFRLSAPTWPPGDLPRLPLGMTLVNSLVLFASVVPMARAIGAVRRDDLRALARTISSTTALGVTFLAIQGLEWLRLVGHGLTLGGSMYGATFYTLIGCHACHVLAAVAWLAVTAVLARRGRFTAARHAPLEMCALYWYFVCGLWALLFPLVYIL
jgi:cytochrome c oxidase subunit 3